MKEKIGLWCLVFCLTLFETREKGFSVRSHTMNPGILWVEMKMVEMGIDPIGEESRSELDHTHEVQEGAAFTENLAKTMPPTPPIPATKRQPSSETPEISFVVACYNEGKYISDALSNLLELGATGNLEIIVVDDDSVDDTYAYICKIQDRRINVVKHQESLGYARSVVDGITKTTGKFVVVIDTLLARHIGSIRPVIDPLKTSEATATIVPQYLPPYAVNIPGALVPRALAFFSRLLWGADFSVFSTSAYGFVGPFIRQVAERSNAGHFFINALNSLLRGGMAIKTIATALVLPTVLPANQGGSR